MCAITKNYYVQESNVVTSPLLYTNRENSSITNTPIAVYTPLTTTEYQEETIKLQRVLHYTASITILIALPALHVVLRQHNKGEPECW